MLRDRSSSVGFRLCTKEGEARGTVMHIRVQWRAISQDDRQAVLQRETRSRVLLRRIDMQITSFSGWWSALSLSPSEVAAVLIDGARPLSTKSRQRRPHW